MLRIKNYWLRSFLYAYATGVGIFAMFSLVFFANMLPELTGDTPTPKKEPHNQMLRSLHNKKVISINDNKQLKFHADTLYFFYFSQSFPYAEKELKTVLKLTNQQEKKQRPFKLCLVYNSTNTEKLKAFKNWANTMNIPLANCYINKDLSFMHYKVIMYQNKIRFQTNDRTDWSFKYIVNFIENLYK